MRQNNIVRTAGVATTIGLGYLFYARVRENNALVQAGFPAPDTSSINALSTQYQSSNNLTIDRQSARLQSDGQIFAGLAVLSAAFTWWAWKKG